MRLFVDRMSAGGRPIELNDSGAAIVCEICHRLDGLALAIELAAGHVNGYGLQGTLDLLTDRFNVIQGGRRTALPRHQTLQRRRYQRQRTVSSGRSSRQNGKALCRGSCVQPQVWLDPEPARTGLKRHEAS